MGGKYSGAVAKFLVLGAPNFSEEWIDYSSVGIGTEHIPELIKMLCDDELNFGDPDSLEVWAPLHAWRALGQLKAAEAVDALKNQLHLIDDNEDDYIATEFPVVFSKIGWPAVQPLAEYLNDNNNPLFAKICAAGSLQIMGKENPALRDRCIEILTSQLRNHDCQDETLNTFLILYLVELGATEAINGIRDAYLSGNVDLDVLGDIKKAEKIPFYPDRKEYQSEDNSFQEIDGFDDAMDAPAIGDEMPFKNSSAKIGRNEPCPCGSGKKYKKCCLNK
jgi:hypothetical protein